MMITWQVNLVLITLKRWKSALPELTSMIHSIDFKLHCILMKNYDRRWHIELTTLFYGVHGIQFGPEVSSNKIRHGMGCRKFVRPCKKRSPGLCFRLLLWFRDRVGFWVAHGRVRQNGWRCVPKSAIMLSTLHFVLELRKRWAGLLLHGEVKHARCHIVSHKLNADLDTTPFFLLLSWFGLQ